MGKIGGYPDAHLMGLVVGDQVELMLAYVLDAAAACLHGRHRLGNALLLSGALRGWEENSREESGGHACGQGFMLSSSC